MRTVWKYEMPSPGQFISYKLPIRAIPLHLAIQDHKIMLWCEVVPPNEMGRDSWMQNMAGEKTFTTIGTGQEIPPLMKHLGTVFDAGNLVWHVYSDWAKR